MRIPILPAFSRYLAISKPNFHSFSAIPCLDDGYRGTMGDSSVFLFTPACLNSRSLGYLQENTDLDMQIIGVVPAGLQNIVWIQEQQVEHKTFEYKFEDFIDSIPGIRRYHRTNTHGMCGDQLPVIYDSEWNGNLGMQYFPTHSPSAHILAIPSSSLEDISMRLPPYHKLILLDQSSFVDVPEAAKKWLRDFVVVKDPRVETAIDSLNDEAALTKFNQCATGEDTLCGITITTRHSRSKDAPLFAAKAKEVFEGEGGATCILDFYDPDKKLSPNVICTYAGTSTDVIIFAAHYDSRNDDLRTLKGPGGNDDGSGVTAIVAIARAIKANKIKFHSTVQLVLFSGEEQGSLGSKAYAKRLYDAPTKINLMVMADMIAYLKPGDSMQMGVIDPRSGDSKNSATIEASDLVKRVGDVYSKTLAIGYTTVCCSDQDSFHNLGFPATFIYERQGPKIVDPAYHQDADLTIRPDKSYSFTQIREITKVLFATLLHTAGFDII